MIFETYSVVHDNDREDQGPPIDDFEGDTLVNDDQAPDHNGLYPLARCPPRTPSPDSPPSCNECERLAAQINAHLIEGIEGTHPFLEAMESGLERPRLSQKLNMQELAASNERLLARNEWLVGEIQKKQAAWERYSEEEKRSYRAKMKELEAKTTSARVKELQTKNENYRKLNNQWVKENAKLRKEKWEKVKGLVVVKGREEELKEKVRRMAKANGVLQKEIEELESRNECEAGCVRRKLSLVQVVGVAALVVWVGWDVVWFMMWL